MSNLSFTACCELCGDADRRLIESEGGKIARGFTRYLGSLGRVISLISDETSLSSAGTSFGLLRTQSPPLFASVNAPLAFFD